jgi:hypothetical protein
VTVQTTTRGDSSYFGRPTVTLGDEELPAYVGEGLAGSKRHNDADDDEEARLPPHPNQRYRAGAGGLASEDCFAASGPSVIRVGSIGANENENGSTAQLTRDVSSRGRSRGGGRQGLHPLLVNYTSPISEFSYVFRIECCADGLHSQICMWRMMRTLVGRCKAPCVLSSNRVLAVFLVRVGSYPNRLYSRLVSYSPLHNL